MARKDKQACGCVSQAQRWVKLCEAHQRECDETSARWAADHARRPWPGEALPKAEDDSWLDN